MVIWCLFHLSVHMGLIYSQKCLEEKNEILQGKLSQLEEHLALLRENPPQEKGEVLGDVLQVGMHRTTCVLGVGVDSHSVPLGSWCSAISRGGLVTEESC